ncbi:MAG: PilN domain-containing protein [Acidobacteria bacterium]|nr:PilN domain-containing protein [Acidobacteriota bacterium]MBV9623204.1 PilN domain-containing protein [Acidobacteriota bacterium]
MIRINLLGTSKPKSRRSAAPSAPVIELGDVGSPKLKILVAMVLAIAGNTGYWYYLDHQAQTIAANMKFAEQKNRELSEVKAKYLEHQKEADNYKRRVDVIVQLHKNQATPVELLNMIGDTVNRTEAVWLNSMKDQGPAISLEGMALSNDAVANLISNLQKTGYFRNIEIKESYQDEQVKDMQAFQFTLTCEKGKS